MPAWPPCHRTRGHAHLFYPPLDDETFPARIERERAALAICSTCPLIEACDKHAQRFPWPDGFVIAGRVISNPTTTEAHEMPKAQAPVDYTPVVEDLPERHFREAAQNQLPPETLALLITHPGVVVRVMTAPTRGPVDTRSKFLRDGTYGRTFKTWVRPITEGPDAGKFGCWAMYEESPEPLAPASSLIPHTTSEEIAAQAEAS